MNESHDTSQGNGIPNWQRVCEVDELALGTCVSIQIGFEPVAVLRSEAGVRAFADSCLHRGARLSEGTFRDGVLTCPGHWWRYDAVTGKLLMHPQSRLAGYEVREADGWIEVAAPAREPAHSLRSVLLAHARGDRA